MQSHSNRSLKTTTTVGRGTDGPDGRYQPFGPGPDDGGSVDVATPRSEPLTRLLAIVVAATMLIIPLDFAELGLSRSGGIDLVRWILLTPVLGACGYLILASPAGPARMFRPPLLWFGLWLGWAWLGATSSADTRQTLIAAFIATCLWAGIPWLVARLGVDGFAKTTVAILAGLAGLGLVDDLQSGLTEGRMNGVAFGFTDLAILCGVGLVWSMVLWDESRSLRWLAPVPVFLVALAGSGARLPTLAAAIACFLVVTHRWTSRLAILAALAAVVIAVQAGDLVPAQFDRADQAVSATGAPVEPSPLNGRLDIWDYGVGLVADDPVTGYGLKAGNAAWTNAYLRGELPIPAGHSHNSILELAAATGLVGAALFTVFLVATFLGLRRNGLRGPMLVGLFLVLCGATEAVVEGQTIGLIQYLALGAMAGAEFNRSGSGPLARAATTART